MKVSIVTAAYNSAATIADTIRSVLSQTHSDWEHIIIDGASTDNTAEIVNSFSSQYAGRLHFISEPDHGIYDAMNKGIAIASGDIVGILNSDDFFTRDNVVERIVKSFRDDIDAVYGDIMYTDPYDTSRIIRYYSSSAFRRWKMKLGFMPAHPSFYCRRHIYQTFGDFDISFKVAADFENLLRIIYVGKTRCKYLPMNFVTMRAGGASTSGLSSHRAILADHIRAYRKNSVHSGMLLDLLRYPYKVAELVSFRLHSHRNA